MQEPSGKMFLFVSGLIYIIFGGISAIVGLLGILGGGVLAASGVAGLGGLAIVGSIGILVSAAFWIFTGIMGVMHKTNREKSQLCFVLGCIAGAFAIFSLFSNILTGLIACALAALYIIGALKNKGVMN